MAYKATRGASKLRDHSIKTTDKTPPPLVFLKIKTLSIKWLVHSRGSDDSDFIIFSWHCPNCCHERRPLRGHERRRRWKRLSVTDATAHSDFIR